MRPIWAVIKAMQTRIPSDFEKRADLLDSLDSISYSASYTAPEAMGMRWKQISETLEYYLGEADATWKQEVASIFSAQTDYKTYLSNEEQA